MTPRSDQVRVGEILPAACDARDLARAFGKSLQTIYDWHKAGKLRRFELGKPMTSKKWSGKLIQEFLDGGRRPSLAAVQRTA
jgi:hypothetical protein